MQDREKPRRDSNKQHQSSSFSMSWSVQTLSKHLGATSSIVPFNFTFPTTVSSRLWRLKSIYQSHPFFWYILCTFDFLIQNDFILWHATSTKTFDFHCWLIIIIFFYLSQKKWILASLLELSFLLPHNTQINFLMPATSSSILTISSDKFEKAHLDSCLTSKNFKGPTLPFLDKAIVKSQPNNA